MSDYKINQTVKIKPYEDEPELLGVIKRISSKSEYVVWGEDNTTYYLTEKDIIE